MIFPLLRHITHRLANLAAVVAIMAMTVLWSCREFEPVSGGDAAGDGTVSFRVVAPKYAGSSSGSRATWGDEYDQMGGTEFETALLDGQVQVEITDADCQQRYAITDLYCEKVEDNPLFVTYEYVGRIEDKDLGALSKVTNGKFHIIANAGQGASLDSDPVFKRSGVAADFEAIPMWGVTTVDFSKLSVGNALNIGDVTLLRSMAKVVIDLDADPSANNYIQSITDVTISTTNGQGYVLPASWIAINSTTSLNRHAARVPDQTPTGPMVFGMDEKSHAEFYLPEIFNGTGDNEITLTINYKTILGDMTGNLYFRRYANGNPGDTPLDVLRNYLYHFIVKKPNSEEVSAILDIIPYSSVELDPDFGLERDPINGWVCFRNEQGFLMCYYDEINKVFYDFDRQRITYEQHATKKPWLKVTDAKGDFKWYFDVETGKMYDANDQEMTGFDRHPITGWLVRRLSNGDVDYYVAPLANKVYDRKLSEVELESRDGTGNYKLLRDGDGNVIIKFDPLTGEVVDNDGKDINFRHDEQGRTIIENGNWYCLYDRATGKFFSSEGKPIKNPFTNPSWQQYLYSNGSLICYYDNETGKFYDIDLDEITFDTHASEPWFIVVDSQGNFCWYLDYTTGAMYDEQGKRLNLDRDRTTGNLIRRGAQGHIAYYVDPVSLLVYDSNQNLVRLEHRNEATNAMKVLNFVGDGGPTTYFFDAAAGILWGSQPSSSHPTGFTVDRTNVIYDRLNKADAQFERDPENQARVIITNNNGGVFRYYDIDKSQFYTEKGIPVSNPFSVQLTHYDDIKNDTGQFICFYNQTEGKFYDGYMREITHEQHPTNPWFKVCDHEGNFKWYVDYLTFKLYNLNGSEMTSPALTRRYDNADVRITSGKRDKETGRVEFIHYRGPVKGTLSYWLDPISLVMYDSSMREILLPRKANKTSALQQFKNNGALLFDFDVLTCQFYQNGTPKELKVKQVNCVDVINNKKTINSNSTTYRTISGFTDVSPASYTMCISGYTDLETDQFRLQSTTNSGIVTTKSGGTLKTVTFSLKSGWGATSNGVISVYEKTSKFNAVSDMSSLSATNNYTRNNRTSITHTSTLNYGFVGVRSTNGNHYFDYINFEWAGTSGAFYILTFYNQSGTEVAVNFRPYDETFYSSTSSSKLYSSNLIEIPFVRQK